MAEGTVKRLLPAVSPSTSLEQWKCIPYQQVLAMIGSKQKLLSKELNEIC